MYTSLLLPTYVFQTDLLTVEGCEATFTIKY